MIPKNPSAMKKSDLRDIVSALESGSSFLVTSHVSPDGDAIGSLLALAYLLKSLGKRVTCVLHDPVPAAYRWLPGADEVRNPSQTLAPFDTAVIVDASRRDRVGNVNDLIGPGIRLIVIDHHLDESPDGDCALVNPTYAAVGELMVDLYAEASVEFSRDAAECAYVALVTDTGGFRYANTTARSHRAAAHLLERGISASEIAGRVFDIMPHRRFKILCHVLNSMSMLNGGRATCTVVTRNDLDSTGAQDDDLNNLINFGRNIEGVDVALMFREVGPSETKLSLRSSKAFNSAEFASQFGGGGHAGAAGATLPWPVLEARERVLEALNHALESKT